MSAAEEPGSRPAGEPTKKRKNEEAERINERAHKWASEFDQQDEDDQYTYLEELAPHMSRMHLQFLQGIIGFDDDVEDEFDDDEDDDDDDDDEGDEGDEGDDGEAA